MLRMRPLALACLGVFAVPVLQPAHAETVLETQTVTAKGYAADALETPQAVEVIEGPGGASTGVAGDLLRGRPGLALHSDGAWGQNPVLRGLKKESVVVLVDGVRVNSAQPQGAIASFLDLGLLDRAEVVKGPTSVLYGSGAMGGVVNLITPEARFSSESRLGGRIGLSTSSVDRGLAGAALLNYSNPDHALVLGVAGRDVDDYKAPDGRVDDTGYRSESFLLKYRHRLTDGLSVRFNVQHHTDHDVWYPGSARAAGQPGVIGVPPALGTVMTHSPEQQRELYEFGVDADVGPGKLSAEVYHQEVFRQIRSWSSSLQRDHMLNDVTFDTNGSRLRYIVPVGDNHVLTVGAETWRMTGDPERYTYGPPAFNVKTPANPFSNGRIESTSLYVQDEFDVGRTRIVAGARWDRTEGDAKQKGAQTTGLEHTDNTLSWSLGAIHPLTAKLSVYGNVGRAHRAADMRERFEDSPRGDGFYHVGNPQLDPERSTSFELGVKGRDGQLDYHLAAFHTRIDDYIAGRVTGAVNPQGLQIKRTENLDKVTIRGFEGGISMPVGVFVADAGFTWLHGKNHQDDEPLYQMPANELRLGLGQPAERGFYWHGQLRLVAEQDRIAKRFSNGTENKTSGFVTADANFGWRFGKVGGFASTGIDVRLTNLFDKRYHEHLTDGISGQEISAPGRGIAVSLNGSF